MFLGNFRGNGDREHVRKNIKEAEYWDFSVNEHAFKGIRKYYYYYYCFLRTYLIMQDYPTFINHINQIKQQEFSAAIKPHNSVPKTIPVPLTDSALNNLSSAFSNMHIPLSPSASPSRSKKQEINNNKEKDRRDRAGSKGELNAETPFKLSVVSHSVCTNLKIYGPQQLTQLLDGRCCHIDVHYSMPYAKHSPPPHTSDTSVPRRIS